MQNPALNLLVSVPFPSWLSRQSCFVLKFIAVSYFLKSHMRHTSFLTSYKLKLRRCFGSHLNFFLQYFDIRIDLHGLIFSHLRLHYWKPSGYVNGCLNFFSNLRRKNRSIFCILDLIKKILSILGWQWGRTKTKETKKY